MLLDALRGLPGFRISGLGMGLGGAQLLPGPLLLLPEQVQLGGRQGLLLTGTPCLPGGRVGSPPGGWVLPGTAHRAGGAGGQGVGQVPSGILPQQGLLGLQPVGQGLPQHLFLRRFLPGFLDVLFRCCPPLFPQDQLLPGGGLLFQRLLPFQQGGQLFRCGLTVFHKGGASLHPLPQGLSQLLQPGELLLPLRDLGAGSSCPFLQIPGPRQFLPPLGQLGFLLSQGHHALPEFLGLLPVFGSLGGGLFPLGQSGAGLGLGLFRLLFGLFPLEIGLRLLQQGLLPLQGLGQLLVFPAQGGFPKGQSFLPLLQSGQGVGLLFLQQGRPQGLPLPQGVFQLPGPAVEALRDPPPQPGGEQGLQHFSLVLGVGPQQPEKVPLG